MRQPTLADHGAAHLRGLVLGAHDDGEVLAEGVAQGLDAPHEPSPESAWRPWKRHVASSDNGECSVVVESAELLCLPLGEVVAGVRNAGLMS